MKARDSTKISIIGVGHVGSVIGFLLAMRGCATEIVLCGRDGDDAAAQESRQRAAAEALDIRHAIAFTTHRLEVRAGCSEDTRDSDLIIMTASAKMVPGKFTNRMDLAASNTDLMRGLISRLAGLSPGAVIINVTNPVDVLTYHIYKISGFDWWRVLGTGTLVDTLRLRRRLSDAMDVFAADLRVYVIGEHGDSSVATLSQATIGGMNLARMVDSQEICQAMLREAEEDARMIGMEIFHSRGYTNYAVAMAVEMIVDSIVNDRSITVPVSVFVDGCCGLTDVCLSLPCVISRRGIKQRLVPELSEQELASLRQSAGVIQAAIQKTGGRG